MAKGVLQGRAELVILPACRLPFPVRRLHPVEEIVSE